MFIIVAGVLCRTDHLPDGGKRWSRFSRNAPVGYVANGFRQIQGQATGRRYVVVLSASENATAVLLPRGGVATLTAAAAAA